MLTIIMLHTQCNNPSPEKICNDTASRGKIISILTNNHHYLNQVMDSISQNNHGMEMMDSYHDMKRTTLSGKGMKKMMMSDTSMHRMMMDMMETDSAFCSKMGNWMIENPKMKKMMKDKMMQHEYIKDSRNNMK